MQREAEGSEVRRSYTACVVTVVVATDDGECERDDAPFCCTSILGQQRVFSGYASEKPEPCSQALPSFLSGRGEGLETRLSEKCIAPQL